MLASLLADILAFGELMVVKTSIVKPEGLNFHFKPESTTSESTCFLPALMFLPRTSDNQSHQGVDCYQS